MSNIDKLEQQIEYQYAVLSCYYCDKEKVSDEEWLLAEEADNEGWKVIREKVKCPSCNKTQFYKGDLVYHYPSNLLLIYSIKHNKTFTSNLTLISRGEFRK